MREPFRERITYPTLGKFGTSSSTQKCHEYRGYVIVTRRVGVIGLIHVVMRVLEGHHPPLPGCHVEEIAGLISIQVIFAIICP